QSGMENFFYWNLGVNYETSGRLEYAIASYRIALRYPPRSTDLQLYASIATRLGYCLLQTRSREATLAYLDEAGRQAAPAGQRRVIRWLLHQPAAHPAPL